MQRELLVSVVAAFAVASWGLACGGGGGGNGVPDQGTDTPVEAGPDAAEVPDVSEVPEVGPEAETEEQIQIVCTPATEAEDCKDTPVPDACHEAFCNTATPEGACEVRAKADGAPCDDNEACTQGDECVEGVCKPGESVCECTADDEAACDQFEDGNLCNGTLMCDVKTFPYKCVVDPETIPAPCSTQDDTACKVAQCKPETGLCELTPVNEGQPCPDDSVCTITTVCQAGECVATEVRDCRDFLDAPANTVENLCTTDTCDAKLGCVHKPNSDPCDDGNACTVDDTCADSACKPGPARNCNDGDFCTDDSCDPEDGCQHPPHSCDDGVPCTDDSCDSVAGACVNAWRSDAWEGAKGNDTCADGKDNDCDSKVDGEDPQCRLSVTAVTPDEGPSAGGSVVILEGESLDLLEPDGTVVFAGAEVEFEVLSGTKVRVTTPPHDIGLVSVAVSDGVVDYVGTDLFLYTDKVPEDSPILAVLLDPAMHEMKEGETTPTYLAQVAIPGVTDVEVPDPSGVKAQIGWGERGTNPWEDPSWQWVDADLQDTSGGTFMYGKALKIDVGGYLAVAARFSTDGGVTWQFGDMDGSANGYDPALASVLTVWGVPEVGSIVINELMWMGSKGAPFDEWFELRNMTPAPFDLAGYLVTGAGVTNTSFVLDDAKHEVRNLILEPYGYFLVAEYDAEKFGILPASAVNVAPDVIGKNTMVLPNPSPSQPAVYKLVTPNAMVIDTAVCSGQIGDLGQGPDKPVRSMERNKVPGDGSKEASWHVAAAHTGWDGDPRQTLNFGTPRAPNSDIPLCSADGDCADAFPDVELGECEKEVCDLTVARCGIAPIQDGEACDDGLFCNEGETCIGGQCAGGAGRDCADDSPCTIDSCDEDADMCVSVEDPAALEGPAMSASCSDTVDNDCDGATDVDDPQCLLKIDSVDPPVVPCGAGWTITLHGGGFDLPVTDVMLDETSLEFTVIDSAGIEAGLPVIDVAGDYDLSVTDGAVTAVLVDGLRCIDLDISIWGNTQWPVEPMEIAVGSTTGLVYGRVWADGVTNVEPVDGSKVIAQLGMGPAGSDPLIDFGWQWVDAAFNDQCLDCGENYEYFAEITASEAGEFILGFRYSVDGGYHFQYGDLTVKDAEGNILSDGSVDGWSPDTALAVSVTAP